MAKTNEPRGINKLNIQTLNSKKHGYIRLSLIMNNRGAQWPPPKRPNSAMASWRSLRCAMAVVLLCRKPRRALAVNLLIVVPNLLIVPSRRAMAVVAITCRAMAGMVLVNL